MFKLSGTVYRSGSDERVQYASVKAWAAGEKAAHTITNEDGDFKFDKLNPGDWTLVAMHEKYFPSKRSKLNLVGDSDNVRIELTPLVGEVDMEKGVKFFHSLLISFFVLLVVYIVVHALAPVLGIPSGESFIWSTEPWKFVEIVLWGLAGVLVSKIIEVAWYLRKKRFFGEGIVMHIAHLVSTPVLVLIAVLILSLATFEITLANESTISVDLSNPTIMAAVAFLLGTGPWALWKFIQDTAERFMGQQEE